MQYTVDASSKSWNGTSLLSAIGQFMGGALTDLCSFVMTKSEVENWGLACT